jgi:hypothetical protein
MTILLEEKINLINGFCFVNIIILPILGYFQLLWGYFLLI